jgi:acetyltransferase-like isoleucine patch superfamily enzyme
MPGITVGKGCTILPGTLVNRDLADGSVVGGNPAKPVDQ